MIKHIDELTILPVDYSLHMFSINETKIDSSINDCEVYIPRYEIFRRDRDRRCGGVCFYIENTINSVRQGLDQIIKI